MHAYISIIYYVSLSYIIYIVFYWPCTLTMVPMAIMLCEDDVTAPHLTSHLVTLLENLYYPFNSQGSPGKHSARHLPPLYNFP